MGILVAILIIAVIAAVGYALWQRQRAGAGAATGGIGRQRSSPLPRRSRANASRDPMAAAVHEHAEATDPQDVIAAEQRMQAQASQVSAGLQAQARNDQGAYDEPYAGDPRADGYAQPAPGQNGYDPAVGYTNTTHGYSAAPPTSDLHLDGTIDPQTGQRTDGYGDPDNDPRLDDPRYEGRTARDYDPNTENPEYR